MTTTLTSTRAVVDEFLSRLGSGDRSTVLEMFAEPADHFVPGSEIVPWLGPRRTTRAEIGEFFAAIAEHATTERFEIERIFVDGDEAIVAGNFRHRIHATGKSFDSPFALRLTITDGQVTRYLMLEDSHALAKAFTPLSR